MQLEYQRPELQPNYDLHSDAEALYIEGIGYIAQYHYYVDRMWSHGIIYFMRDLMSREIDRGLTCDVDRLHSLNSKIREYESCQSS